MNLGGRIKYLLDKRNWSQRDLLDRIPALEPATLSALIKRDSKRSEFATEIAAVFGVSLSWLLTGDGSEESVQASPKRSADVIRVSTGWRKTATLLELAIEKGVKPELIEKLLDAAIASVDSKKS